MGSFLIGMILIPSNRRAWNGFRSLIFSVLLVHCMTEYAGIDVAVSRSTLRAEALGIVPQADRILGSRFEVLPRSSPIILPLKRVGLQHDRFTKIQLRQGDTIDLYISQGGKMT